MAKITKAAHEEMLAALRIASEFIGNIPSGPLGTSEPAYKALVAIDDAIALAEGRPTGANANPWVAA